MFFFFLFVCLFFIIILPFHPDTIIMQSLNAWAVIFFSLAGWFSELCQKKMIKRQWVFAFFKSFLLRNGSVNLGDFALNNAKLGREIWFKLKIDFIETNFAVRKIITVMRITRVQSSQIRTLIKELLAKYKLFKKLPQISHIHKTLIFSSINVNL